MSLKKYTPARLLFLAVFIVMLVLNFLTPLLSDDFGYSFSWVDDSRMTSLSQLIPSLAQHRVITNGRVMAHAMVFVLLMLPKAVFNVLNALNCLILMMLALKYCATGDAKKDTLLLLFGVLAVWVFMPGFGSVFLWLDGSVNYSWGIAFLAAFLLPYMQLYVKKEFNASIIIKVLFVLLAFVAGAYSENGSAAAIFAAFMLLLCSLIRDKKLNVYLTVCLAAAFIGFLFMMAAPAELGGRAGEFSIAAVAEKARLIVSRTKEELLPLFCVYALLLVFNFKGGRKEANILSAILVLAGLLSLVTFCLAAYFVDRHFCVTVFFMIIACQVLLGDMLLRGIKKPADILCTVLAVVFVFNFVIGVIDIGALFMNSRVRQQEINAAHEAGQQIAELTPYYPSSKYCPVTTEDIMDDPLDWPNSAIADYYGFEGVTKKY